MRNLSPFSTYTNFFYRKSWRYNPGCGFGASEVTHWIAFEGWALSYGVPASYPNVCSSQGSVPFRRNNETALIYHRPAVNAAYFEKTTPHCSRHTANGM